MKKRCLNSKCKAYNKEEVYEDDYKICAECGQHTLEDIAFTKSENLPKYNLDNRLDYQSGDRTMIEGDNIATQNVDNRSSVINTNTSNVVNNISNIQSAQVLMTCDISGKTVPLNETIVCKGCRKRISSEFFDNKALLCVECCDKNGSSKASENKHRIAEDKAIPSLVSNLNETVARQRPIVEPINQDGGQDSSIFKKTLIFVAVIAVAIVSYLYFAKSDTEDEKQTPTEVSVTEESNTSAESTAKVPAVTNDPSKTAAKPASASIADKATPAAIELSAFDEGKKAYDEGNFSKANVFLTKASGEGKSGANYYLAHMHQGGKGVSKNVKKSYEYMLKAAEGGYANAYYEIAEMLRTGNGTESNRINAKKWYEKAALSDGKNSDKAAQALTKYY